MAQRRSAQQEREQQEASSDSGDVALGDIEFAEVDEPDESARGTVLLCANDGKPAVVKTSDPRASTVYYCAECGTASSQAIEDLGVRELEGQTE